MAKIIWKEPSEDDPIFKTGFVISSPKLRTDINKPKIDFNIIGKQSSMCKERIRAYQDAETKLLKEQGGKVFFHAGETQYASSELFRDNMPNLEKQNQKLFKQACNQQNLKIDSLIKCIDKFKNASLFFFN